MVCSKRPMRKAEYLILFDLQSADEMASPDLKMMEDQLRRKSIVDSIFHDHMKPRHRDLDNLDEDRP